MRTRVVVIRSRTSLAVVLMLAAVALWLWPVGLGGKMPVGGDVTSFSMGLMAFLHDSLRAGRLPVWNDLWGYGFPGLAESQMGVYYPPHLLFYGLLPVETAYTASLVFHTAWAALGAFWAARRFGSSPAGAALGGFAWSTCGFFMIHLPHQWGYTTGSWMPWAWGLAWPLARGDGSWRTAAGLAAVLTIQVLPGHFQLAFCTQFGVLIIALCALRERWAMGAKGVRGPLLLLAALAAVFPLGAAQLWPTLRLARLAATQRDYEYLSEFASTPFHLVSYVAPWLFHGSALWRPLVWDPFRTSPEEHLTYVGLVPLFLAWGAVRRGWRSDSETRVLTILALATLILSLGPYVPGFAYWCRLPGFSFFRGSARWSLATGLALSLLAAQGFDRLTELARPGRTLSRFVAFAAVATLLTLGTVELAVRGTDGRGWPAVSRGFDRVFEVWPWSNPPKIQSLGREARAFHPDLLLSYAREEARRGKALDLFATSPRFVDERTRIYGRELGETGTMLAALLVVAACGRHLRLFRASLVVLTLLDLWALGRHRAIDLAPIQPLETQSTVLARLGREARGTRTANPAQNLAMVAGVAPLRAYRTLDSPALPALTNLASAPMPVPQRLPAFRASGTKLRVFDALDARANPREGVDNLQDPALASWLFGADLVSTQGPWLSRFSVWDAVPDATRAWRLPLTPERQTAMLDVAADDVTTILSVFERAKPLDWRSPRPGRLEVDIDSEGDELVVISQLADPQWRARWVGKASEQPGTIHAVFRAKGQGGWQAVRVPEPGRWTLCLDYDARDVRQGLVVSGVSWFLMLGAVVFAGRRRPNVANKG